jgi:hypothetical protein
MSAVDDRICLFYVAECINDLEDIDDLEHLKEAIREIKDELLRNIGVNVMIKRSENQAIHDRNRRNK